LLYWNRSPAGLFLEPEINIKGMLSKITTFLKEVRLEMKKVNWPTRQQTLRYTFIVIGISVAVAVYLGAMDFILTTLLNKFIL
jgi:preprotein translocase subunit SecE